MLLNIHPENPEPRKIALVAECLKDGGIVIYPTDTIYGMGCDILRTKTVEKVAKLKGIRADKAQFAIICSDLSHLSEFAMGVDTPTFRLLKRVLPGGYTFILKASSNVPKIFKQKKKTIGIRVPDHPIPLEIVRSLGNPIVTTSLHISDKILQYPTDPDLIYEQYKKDVDIVIDGGYGKNNSSTIIDCTSSPFTILREGAGSIEDIGLNY